MTDAHLPGGGPSGTGAARGEPPSVTPPGGWRLAIDFGTSRTAAATATDGGVPVPLPLAAGTPTMPSGVLLLDGQVHTGEAAVRLAAVNPDGFEPAPKRRLGEDEILLDRTPVSPLRLIAAVLSEVHAAAVRRHSGRPPSEVVLTHPEAWRGHRLERLREAAVGGGIPADRIRMVSEPVAAAWHHAASGRWTAPIGSRLAVLDFGGGTVDLALLRYARHDAGARFQVVDQDGIDTLGGHDFDSRLLDWTLDQLRADDRTAMADALAARGPEHLFDTIVLRDQVRRAKHTLSEHASAPVAARLAGEEWSGQVTRGEFASMIGADLDRVAELLERLLVRNDVREDGLQTLFLTGGSTLIPAVQQRVERVVPGRLAAIDDPKQVTSLGALQVPARSVFTTPAPTGTAAVATPPADVGGRPPTDHAQLRTPTALPPWVPGAPVSSTPGPGAPEPQTPPTPDAVPHQSHATSPTNAGVAGAGGAGGAATHERPHDGTWHPGGAQQGRTTAPTTPERRGSGRRVLVVVGGIVAALIALIVLISQLASGGGGSSLDAELLIERLPDGFGACDTYDTADPDRSVTVRCEPVSGASAAYAVQYSDPADMAADLDSWAAPGVLEADQACEAGTEGVSYSFDGQDAGRYLCGIAVDDGVPRIVWTQDDVNVLVIADGYPGEMGALYDWFVGLPPVGSS